MELFRFLTAGSVDDGKSTLIGHLLHLVNALKSDQLDQVKSLGSVDQSLNYAFFTDGLKSERALGITIDVSYKYFSTPKRRFIIADCPGHQEYTRNMFTGASTADLVVLMVNIQNGITEQTRRHLKISQLLNIPNIVFCINKMDLVGYNEEAFHTLKALLSKLGDFSKSNELFIPVSATKGDNLVKNSANMPWYKGETLLETLNTCNKSKVKDVEACFPVQLSLLVHNTHQLFGNAFEGSFRVGEDVKLLPNNIKTRISTIFQFDQAIKEISDGAYGSLVLDTDLEINRGAILVKANQNDIPTTNLLAKLCWMDETPAQLNQKYILKCATQEVSCQIKTITDSDNDEVGLNTIFTANLISNKAIVARPYVQNRMLGAFILIDSQTNQTVAGGIVL